MTHVVDRRHRTQVQGGDRLTVLATEITHYHEAVREAFGCATEYAIKAGEALIKAKALVKHGEWLPWLYDNCELPERTAQFYMQVSRRKDELVKNAGVADLSLHRAAFLLSDASRRVKTTEELAREDRVKRHIEKRQAEADKQQLEKHDHQVKDFLNAIKAFEEAYAVAGKSVSKFSPEAVAFAVRRLDRVAAAVETAKEHLEPKRYAAKPLSKPRSGKPFVGLDAARRHYLDQCADPGVDIDAEVEIIRDAFKEITGKRMGRNGQADHGEARR